MTKPRILLLDFETSPAKGYFFGPIWETNIIEVIEYEQILSVAWKWHGEQKVKVIGQDDFNGYKKGKLNDKELVTFFADIFEKADIVVAHNGDKFDLTVFNTRLLAHGLNPIQPSKSFDTKKISKSKFHLPSNKLDDIADFLKIEGKFSHSGKSMWFGCEAGNEEDWKLMKKYNKQDVEVLSQVFDKIIPFVKFTNQFTRDITCPNPACQSNHLTKHSKVMVKGGWKQRYRCQDCGSLYTDPQKNLTFIK